MERPVFVMGSMGSGTTLLRLILDSHPNLAIGQETGFMRAANANYFIPFWRSGGVWLERLGLDEDDLDRSVRSFYDDVFSGFAKAQGAQRWGDKTPYHIWHMRQMGRIFPDAQFVATVRHPGAVANSLGRFQWKWDRGVAHWQRANAEMLNRGADLGERFHLCRYEDLVAKPEAVLAEVLEYLDEPWDDAVLEHHVQAHPTIVEGRTRSSDPIDPARTSKWLSNTSKEQLERLASRTGAMSSLLGYGSAEPLPMSPLNRTNPAMLSITGDDLAAYMATDPGAVPPEGSLPTFENGLYTPDNFAAQLRAAYEAGRDGGHVRATYRRRVERPTKKARKRNQRTAPKPGLLNKVRRRSARLLDPDRER